MTNKLTIIIPCYNCKETLKEAVDSIYTQNIDIPFEIIMVDDNSTDNTVSVMNKLAEKYPEIKLFYHKENKGGGATRNTAVKNSTGNIIFCLDSDDILPPNTLSKMYKYMLEKDCDGVTIHKSIKFNGTNPSDIDHVDISPFVSKKIPFDSLISRTINFQPLFVNFMYTREAFDRLGGYPTNHGYDTPGFGWRFMCAGLKAYTCPDSGYLHRINFKESYYLREYNEGKINHDWREIFLENYYVFNKEALKLIESFDYKDFTKDIIQELVKLDNMYKPNLNNVLGKKYPKLEIENREIKSTKRNSLTGYLYRIKSKIKKIFLK